jgi:hypothetical protein
MQQWERHKLCDHMFKSLNRQELAKLLPPELRPGPANTVRFQATWPSLNTVIKDHGLLWAIRALHGVFVFLARYHPRSLWGVRWLAPDHSLEWRDGLMQNMRHNTVEIRKEFEEYMEDFPAEMEALFFEGVEEGTYGPEAQAALESVWLESMRVEAW